MSRGYGFPKEVYPMREDTWRSWNHIWIDSSKGGVPGEWKVDPTLRDHWSGVAGYTTKYAFVNAFDQINSPDAGEVIVPQGFVLAGGDATAIQNYMSATVIGQPNNYPYGDAYERLNTNYVTLADNTTTCPEVSSGTRMGQMCRRALGFNHAHMYQEIYMRQTPQNAVFLNEGIIEIPMFPSSTAHVANEVAKCVTYEYTNAPFIGQAVTFGTAAARGRLVEASGSWQVVGQVIGVETVDANEGVRGMFEKLGINPWLLFREGSWYTGYEGVNTMPFADTNYLWPANQPDFNGIPNLTDGSHYSSTKTFTYTFTAADISAISGADKSGSSITISLSDYAFGWSVIPFGVPYFSGTTQGSGAFGTIDGDYNFTFTQALSGANAVWGDTATITFSGAGLVPGLPVNLDIAGVAGLVRVDINIVPSAVS